MKAIVLTKYGSPDGLQLTEIEKPTPKDNNVLIRVRATTVTAGSFEIRTLNFPIWLMLPIRIYVGFIKPRNCAAAVFLERIRLDLREDNELYSLPGERVLDYSDLKNLEFL